MGGSGNFADAFGKEAGGGGRRGAPPRAFPDPPASGRRGGDEKNFRKVLAVPEKSVTLQSFSALPEREPPGEDIERFTIDKFESSTRASPLPGTLPEIPKRRYRKK